MLELPDRRLVVLELGEDLPDLTPPATVAEIESGRVLVRRGDQETTLFVDGQEAR